MKKCACEWLFPSGPEIKSKDKAADVCLNARNGF